MNQPDMVIKEADKGGAVTVLSKNYYRAMAYEHLSNSRLTTNSVKEQNSEVVNMNEPHDLKVRPIVAGPRCPNRKLSELIDTLLKPFLKHVKSHIRDSIDFLNKFDRNTDGKKLLQLFMQSAYTQTYRTLLGWK